MNETKMIRKALRKELTEALTLHIKLLQEVEEISKENMEAVTFMMRSFGFMLDRAPFVLYQETDEEDLFYMMFQYYSLLNELKYNIVLQFPDAELNHEKLLTLANQFPNTYEEDLKQWWQQKTGLTVDDTKQTLSISSLHYHE